MSTCTATTDQGVIEKNITEPVTRHYEAKVGKNLYRVTNIYLGKVDLANALEKLIVGKILASENIDLPQGN